MLVWSLGHPGFSFHFFVICGKQQRGGMLLGIGRPLRELLLSAMSLLTCGSLETVDMKKAGLSQGEIFNPG